METGSPWKKSRTRGGGEWNSSDTSDVLAHMDALLRSATLSGVTSDGSAMGSSDGIIAGGRLVAFWPGHQSTDSGLIGPPRTMRRAVATSERRFSEGNRLSSELCVARSNQVRDGLPTFCRRRANCVTPRMTRTTCRRRSIHPAFSRHHCTCSFFS